MTPIPQAAIDAVALVLCDVEGQPEPEHYALADDVLRAAEQAWPHDPPKRDLTGTVNGQFSRGPAGSMYRRDAQPPGPARPPFGFGPPEVRA